MRDGLELCLYQGNNIVLKSSWQALELIGYLSEVVVLALDPAGYPCISSSPVTPPLGKQNEGACVVPAGIGYGKREFYVPRGVGGNTGMPCLPAGMPVQNCLLGSSRGLAA